jgi:RNA polymerase sigma factor (sigma-70 family)
MQNLSRPQFLDLLDSDPQAALTGFYRFLTWTFNKVPPRPGRTLCREDQEDVKHEVFVHCVEKDFRVLRQYIPSGRPFAAWLYTVAHNVSIDYIRKKEPKHKVVSIHKDSSGKSLKDSIVNPIDDAKRYMIARYVPIAKKMIGGLDHYCRLLLEMAADEFTPKEMVLALGLPSNQNKEVSDRLRYCREKLKKLLAGAGIDIGSILKC